MEPEWFNSVFKRFRHWILGRGIFIQFKLYALSRIVQKLTVAQMLKIGLSTALNGTRQSVILFLNLITKFQFTSPYKIYKLYVLILPSHLRQDL